MPTVKAEVDVSHVYSKVAHAATFLLFLIAADLTDAISALATAMPATASAHQAAQAAEEILSTNPKGKTLTAAVEPESS